MTLQAFLEWRLDSDISQYWNWNTKIIFQYVQAEYVTELNHVNQASLFDDIITKKSRTKFGGRPKQEYRFMDQGNHMRGMSFNMTLTWCIMPRVGALSTGLGIYPTKTFCNKLEHISTDMESLAMHTR